MVKLESYMIHKELRKGPEWLNKLLGLLNISTLPCVTVTHFLHLERGSVIQASVNRKGYLNVAEIMEMRLEAKKQALEIYNKLNKE